MYLWDTHMVGHSANQHPTLLLHIQRVQWDEIGLPTPAVAEVLRGRAEFALKAIPGASHLGARATLANLRVHHKI